MEVEEIIQKIVEIFVLYTPKVIGAIAVWIIGGWVVKLLTNSFGRLLDNRKIDPSLSPFLKGLVGALLKILLVISVLSTLGIAMTSFVAIIGAAGLAIGMALSGTLQNFAGGVIILIFKPYKVGDMIQAQGFLGTVREIQIFNTILKTPDNKTIIIPNGGLSTGSLTNLSAEPLRRVDWVVGMAYGDDVDHAKTVIRNLCEADPRILKEPAVFVAVSALADSSVNFTVRAWVKMEDYWNVFFDLNENIYKNFGQEGLNIPFPQMDVHLHKVAE